MKITIYDEQKNTDVLDLRTLDVYSEAFETEHYTFRYKPDSYAQKNIRSVAEEQEACFRKITERLGILFRDTIHYFLTETPEENGKILAELFGEYAPGNGFAIGPNHVFAVYCEQIRCIGAHEDTHLISYAYCDPSCAFLSEGLAMFMDEEWWGKPNVEWVRLFLDDGRYRSVFELSDDETFWTVPCEISYPIAGAFTAFLAERLGIGPFLEGIYKPNEPLFEKAERVFRTSPAAIENTFTDWIKSH
ncbi:MAG: hypothetical protein IJJ86_01265 [Clostridia bacterium]|nr:hypothetical protein [Clostridia bacterium]